jgi:hypothetical protein
MHPAGEVHLVRWPAAAGERRRLGATGALCLLLVEPEDVPPDDIGGNEDWVRTTAGPMERHWRIERLRALNSRPSGRPTVDDDLLRIGDRSLPLGAADGRLVQRLCEQFGELVPRAELRCAGGASLTDSALSVRLFRLRRLLGPLGLDITTVRGQGYVLEASGVPVSGP